MKKLFLTLSSLRIALKEKKISEGSLWDTLLFLDCDRYAFFNDESLIDEMLQIIKKAEGQNNGRCIAWRQENCLTAQNQLSNLLKDNGLAPLNPNLPPIDDPEFLKVAVERVNNKNGSTKIVVYT